MKETIWLAPNWSFRHRPLFVSVVLCPWSTMGVIWREPISTQALQYLWYLQGRHPHMIMTTIRIEGWKQRSDWLDVRRFRPERRFHVRRLIPLFLLSVSVVFGSAPEYTTDFYPTSGYAPASSSFSYDAAAPVGSQSAGSILAGIQHSCRPRSRIRWPVYHSRDAGRITELWGCPRLEHLRIADLVRIARVRWLRLNSRRRLRSGLRRHKFIHRLNSSPLRIDC